MEQLDLTAAVAASGGTSYWKVRTIVLNYDWDDSANSFIRVKVFGQNGETRTLLWSGAAAHTLIASLNKANLSSNSLQKRVLSQAVTDGKLGAGTYSGTPD